MFLQFVCFILKTLTIWWTLTLWILRKAAAKRLVEKKEEEKMVVVVEEEVVVEEGEEVVVGDTTMATIIRVKSDDSSITGEVEERGSNKIDFTLTRSRAHMPSWILEERWPVADQYKAGEIQLDFP